MRQCPRMELLNFDFAQSSSSVVSRPRSVDELLWLPQNPLPMIEGNILPNVVLDSILSRRCSLAVILAV